MPAGPTSQDRSIVMVRPKHCNEMQVVYLNGARLQLMWHEMQAQFRHPLFVAMLIGIAVVIILIGPYSHLLNLRPLAMGLFYAVAFGSFTLGLYGALWLCHRRGWAAWSLLTVGFAALFATVCGLGAALILGAPMPSAADLAKVTGFNLTVGYLGEIIHAVFLMPRILADLRRRPVEELRAKMILPDVQAESAGAQAPPPVETVRDVLPVDVRIFGQNFALARITALEAEEHYVVIHSQDGARQMLRGRIADAVAAMPEGYGLRVHRSHWVAGRAILKSEQVQGQMMLCLSDGRNVPVARSRQSEVREWLRRHQDIKKAPERGA